VQRARRESGAANRNLVVLSALARRARAAADENIPRGRRCQLREYELMFVLAPDLQEEGVTATTERINTLITNRGGEITKVDTWGRRRMAYPIRRHVDGYYTIMRFRLESHLTEELDRNLRLTEQVMRHLIVRAEEVPTPRPVIRRQAVVVEETKE
jgi:small subunit ribosomal protein S6